MTAARREALRARLRDAGLDAVLVTKLVNVRYLTGFTGSAGELLVTAAGDDVLVTDGRYRQQVGLQAPDVEALIVPPAGWLAARLDGAQSLGLESDAVSWDRARSLIEALSGVDVVPAAGHVEQLRRVKDDDELALLRRRMYHSAADEHALAQERELLEALRVRRAQFVGMPGG